MLTSDRVRLYIPDVPEFASVLAAARSMQGCEVAPHADGYFRIEAASPLEFSRKALGLKPAIWYGLFTGGLRGRIEQFDRDLVRIVALPDPAA